MSELTNDTMGRYNLGQITLKEFADIVQKRMLLRINLIENPGESMGDPVVKARYEDWKKNPRPKEGKMVNNTPLVGFGKPGIGKTEKLRTVTKDITQNRAGIPVDVGLKEVRLGSLTAEDLTGLPQFEEIETTSNKQLFTIFAPLKLLPLTKDMGGDDPDFGVLVLDEITTCDRTVRQAILQLLDSSRQLAGGYHLPDGWIMVALGNGEGDGADIESLPPVVMSRMSGYNLIVDEDDWFSWAIDHEIHPAIYGYLKMDKKKLFHIPEGDLSQEESYQFATPRTWTAASNELCEAEYWANGPISPGSVQNIVASTIGLADATSVAAFYENQKNVIPMEEIKSGDAIKRSLGSIKTETLYLSQQAIINEMLDICKDVKTTNKVGLTAGANATSKSFNFAAGKGLTGKAANASKANYDAKTLSNIVKFVIWCEGAKAGGALDWAVDTFSILSQKSCDSQKKPINAIQHILSSDPTFRQLCPEFAEFTGRHKEIMKLMQAADDGSLSKEEV